MEGEIVNYQVARGNEEDRLADSVNRLIDDGYQPHGSISVCVDPDDVVIFAQAMVKPFRSTSDLYHTVETSFDQSDS